MTKGDYFSTILRSSKSVFSFKEIALLWGESGSNATWSRINYYVKTGKLLRIRKGLYVKDHNYDLLEFATKIITPSYISFETVLAKEGIVFQYYDEIFAASYLSRNISCDNHNFNFKKLKQEVLTNDIGIINKINYALASPERAFLDTLYINKNYYFDNLSPLNWDEVFKILPLYNNKRMCKEVQKLYSDSH